MAIKFQDSLEIKGGNASVVYLEGAGGTGSSTMFQAHNPDDGAGHGGGTAYLKSSGWGEAQLAVGSYRWTQGGGKMTVTGGVYYFNTGNVGIGTGNPAEKLDVNGAIAIGGSTFVDSTKSNIYLNSSNSSGGQGIFFRNGFTYNASITTEDHNGSFADGICISGYDGVSFSTGSNERQERMRVAQNGNVGIGVTNPTRKLHISAGSGYAALFDSTNRYKIGFANGGVEEWWIASNANGSFSIHENNVGDQLTISAGGNLTVSGSVSATGGNSSQWNTAYGWGNHADAGYLTSETDSQTLSFNDQNGELTISNGNTIDLDSRFFDATGRNKWYNISAIGAQAKRYRIARVYYCPQHWDDTWQNIEFELLEEGYNASYVKYSLFGYYNGSTNQTLNLKVTDFRGLGADTQRYNMFLGEHIDAGWEHSGRPVFYTDIFVDVSYYKSLKITADTFGHSYQNTDPSSGAAITVFYDNPDVIDIEYGNVPKTNTYVGDDAMLWNTSNFTQTNVSNWNTAYGWGNHAGLYDAAGAADAVNVRIDEEVLPAIDTKVSKAGDQVTGTLSVGGSAAYDSTGLALDVQGNMGIWGSNKLYFKITSDNYNTWSTSQYADGSTHKFNAQAFSFTNEGYSASVFMNINSSGVGMSRNLVLGNEVYGDRNAYGNWGARLFFNGSNSDAQNNYYIGTNGEDYGGNYSKLDLRWHTGIRMGAQAGYGGIRFYDNEDLNTRIMSIGETDSNVRIDNNLWIGGAGGWITDLLNAKLGATAKATSANLVVSTAASGSVLMKHNNSEANAWIFQEAAANWGLYWFNTGSQSGQSIGNRYTTVGAEMFGFKDGNSQYAIQAPQGWDGVNSSTHYQWMISNYTGGAYFNNDVESRTGFYVNGNKVATESYAAGAADVVNTRIDEEVLPLIDTKADASHNHDDRYYTESEIDNKLSSYTPLQSRSDFADGTLVKTNINASGTNGDSFLLQVRGKSYRTDESPYDLVLQGYIYNNTFINVSAINNGTYFPSPIKVLELEGELCFWWARGSYWNSFEVWVTQASGADSRPENRAYYIENSTEPASDKKVSVEPYHSWSTKDFSASSVSNWNTAYGWGNHAGLYDGIGSADAVNIRIDEEVLPAIPTNNNQLTNGAGFYSGTINLYNNDLVMQGSDPGDIVWKDGAGTENHRIWAGSPNYLTYRNNAGTAYAIVHTGLSGYNASNWDTAYGWGNHAGLYDAAGAADVVNVRIDEEVSPAIDTKLDKSGGTMTGALTITDSATGLLVDSSGHASIRLDRGSTSYDSNLLFYTAGVLNWRMWMDGNDDYLYIRDEVSGNNMMTFQRNSGVTVSKDFKVSGSYTELGNGIGSVSNDGSWNARLNVAGSQHARLDVKSVSDGIITSMYAHTGQGVGKLGTYSNHPAALMAGGTTHVLVGTDGRTHFGSNTNKGYLREFASNTYGSQIGKIARITFTGGFSDWDGDNHAIVSKDINGNMSDSLSVNSYNDVTIRLDSNNNNATSHFYITNNTLGSATNNRLLDINTGTNETEIATAFIPYTDRLQALGRDDRRWQIVFCEILDSAGLHEKNLQNPKGEKQVGEYETGTVLVWKGGKNVPCTEPADHMRMGIAVKDVSSPLVQGAEPVLCTGEVNEGDYLVTSSVEGHAAAISPQYMRQHGLYDCVIGKALESAEGKSHLVKTWVNI